MQVELRSWAMKLLWAAFAVVKVITLEPSLASDLRLDAESQQVFGAFEFICLEQLRSQDRIPELLETVGAMELPANQAAKFLAPQSGRAWMIRPTGEAVDPFIIALSDTTACTVMAPKAKSSPILALFQEHTRSTKIHEEKIGLQI